MTDEPMTARVVRLKTNPEWIIGWVMGYPGGTWYGYRFEFPGKQFADGEGPVGVGGMEHKDTLDSETEAENAVHDAWEEQERYMRRELGDDWKEWHEQISQSDSAPTGEEPAWLPPVRQRTKP